jgi:hypothetical protein
MQETFDQAPVEQASALSVRVGVVELYERGCERVPIKKTRRRLWL